LSSGAEYARYLSLLYSVAVSLQLFLPAWRGEEDDEAPTPVAEPPDDEDDDSWREDCLDALGLLGAISAGVPSGEAESELARLSKSSRRRFNFLPTGPKKKEKELIFTLVQRGNLRGGAFSFKMIIVTLTVVALGNSILDPTSLSKI
jgi:hypothetical protein